MLGVEPNSEHAGGGRMIDGYLVDFWIGVDGLHFVGFWILEGDPEFVKGVDLRGRGLS